MCSQGYASSLAATSLRRLGLHEVTDLDGGFQAWCAAGLPTRPAIALASGNAGQLRPVAEHR
jgi:rhodanese-related sulfurtransferase